MKHNHIKLRLRLLGSGMLLAICMVLAAAPVQADILFVLSNPNQSGAPGDTLTFDGTIANTDALNPLNITGDSFNPASGPNLTFDDAAFQTAFFNPGSSNPIAANGSYFGPLFNVAIGAGAAPGSTFTSDYTVFGTGGAAGTTPFSGTDSFSVTVTPEPSTWAMMALGLSGVIGMHRRRRKAVGTGQWGAGTRQDG